MLVELPLEATVIDFSGFCSSFLPTDSHAELELKTEVGSGNSSTVLKGIYQGKVVAIKKLKKSPTASAKEQQKKLKEFKAEVELLRFVNIFIEVTKSSSCAHANLVNCLGYCENPYFIVMEYLFDNLHDYLQKHKRDLKELIHFAYDIAKGQLQGCVGCDTTRDELPPQQAHTAPRFEEFQHFSTSVLFQRLTGQSWISITM